MANTEQARSICSVAGLSRKFLQKPGSGILGGRGHNDSTTNRMLCSIVRGTTSIIKQTKALVRVEQDAEQVLKILF